ncbi:hypothetical protein [Actinoplanes regularis]|uniref:hypothetical protein n=1 Tax=Actinoplanes regularis TaxID=52697 RepID=UPI0024A2FDC4|nr:hypothetical protein [Actinoplanes regularis]GLW34291.1 hypothetical protein Areg01_72280 [Actinoplanes regularis]
MEVAIARRSVAHRRADDYALTPLRDSRPATGRASSVVECEHCGQAVQCRVYSVADTIRFRARWRLVSRLCIVAAAAMLIAAAISIAGHLPDKPASHLAATLFGLSSVATAGCVLLSIRANRLSRDEDGVRLASWFDPHRLRWSSVLPSD